MSAWTWHLRVSAWTAPRWPRRLLGFGATALLLPSTGLLAAGIVRGPAELAAGFSLMAVLLLGPALAAMALPVDRGTAALPTLPLSARARVTAELLGGLVPPLLLMTLGPLLGWLAFEPLIQPAFDDWESPWVVLLWSWAFWGDRVAASALVGALLLAPGWLLSSHDRLRGAPMALASFLGVATPAAAVLLLSPWGWSAIVPGAAALLGLALALGGPMAERLGDLRWRRRTVGALSRPPLRGFGQELLRNLGEAGLNAIAIAALLSALVGLLAGWRDASGHFILGAILAFCVGVIGAMPPGMVAGTRGGPGFDLAGAVAWLPRPRRWFVKLLLAQGLVAAAVGGALGGALVAADYGSATMVTYVMWPSLAITAALIGRVADGRGQLPSTVSLFLVVISSGAGVVLEAIHPELALWAALLPGAAVVTLSLPAIGLAWAATAEG
ncbi:MAG: hypothetical protein H6740_07600 [Alphaproteobacteria bacterium]|nr:hypothetical protein [Alphaproteobacteria bacterium]